MAPEDAESFGVTVPIETISATPIRWPAKEEDIPEREWLYGNHLVRGRVSLTIAPGGVGKTALSISEALSMVSGKGYAGQACSPMSVWLYNLEEDQTELLRRWYGAAKHFGLTREDIAGRLYVDSGFDQPCIIARSTPEGTVIDEKVVQEIISTIKDRRIDVLVVDPLVSSHSLYNESDNAAMDALLKRGWGRIAHAANCAVSLIHHVRKGGDEVTSESARGAGSLVDAVRSLRTLNKMTTKEAERAGLDVKDRWRYFRVDDGKANMAPPAERSRWFQLVSVRLENGDNIGVARSWSWPESEDLSVFEIIACQRAIDGGEWMAAPQSKMWAGNAVAAALAIDQHCEEGRRQTAEALRFMLGNGALVIVEDFDPHRKKRRYVRVGKRVDLPQDEED